MRTITYNSFIGSIVAVALFTLPAVVVAAGGMSTTFASNPLFSASDIAPGYSVTKTVTVTNNNASTESLYMQSVNAFENGSLGNALFMSVSEQGSASSAYSASLHNFFDGSQYHLADIAPGATETFDITVDFATASGDQYQGTSLGFDLCVGFSGGNQQCSGSQNGGGSNGGGGSGPGGGPISSQGFYIYNQLGTLVPPTAGDITWNTNQPGTTQVVYGLKSGGPYSLDLNAPNFGYPSATAEDTNLVTNHAVSLSGLVPGETYVYRIVSRQTAGGLPTVTQEYELAVPNPLASTPITTFTPAGGSSSGGSTGGTSSGQGGGSPSGGGADAGGPVASSGQNGIGSQLAAAASALNFDSWSCAFWLLLASALTYALWKVLDIARAWRDTITPAARRLRQILIFLAGMLITLGTAFALGETCLYVALYVIIAGLLLWLAWHAYRSYWNR